METENRKTEAAKFQWTEESKTENAKSRKANLLSNTCKAEFLKQVPGTRDSYGSSTSKSLPVHLAIMALTCISKTGKTWPCSHVPLCFFEIWGFKPDNTRQVTLTFTRKNVHSVHLKTMDEACICAFWLKLKQTDANLNTHAGEPDAPRWAHSKHCDPDRKWSAVNTLQEAKLPIHLAKGATFWKYNLDALAP